MEAWNQSLRPKARHHALVLYRVADLPTTPTYTLNPGRPSPGRYILLRPPIAIINGTGILTSFTSATPLQPRLSGRLTLRGTALRRKPWVFGEQVSHLFYRYSCQHSHFRYLHRSSRYGFTDLRNAPLPESDSEESNNPQLRCKF